MWTGVDLRRCQRCHRPSRFWGDRDQETGWVGWCLVCNWVWRFGDVTRLMAFRLLKPLPRDTQGRVCAFLAGDDGYAEVESGSAREELRRVQRVANRRAWIVLLLGSEGPTVRERRWGGMVRKVDFLDVDSDGEMDVNLDFVNPLWKLQLSWQAYHSYVSFWERRSDNILGRVIDMLGKPPTA